MIEVSLKGFDKFAAFLKRKITDVPNAVLEKMNDISIHLRERIIAKLSGRVLKVRTGYLRASIQIHPAKKIDGFFGGVFTETVYAKIHEFGGEIKPKRGQFLTFRIDDKVVRVKSVRIPARPFFYPTLEEEKNFINKKLDGIVAEIIK